LCAPLFSTVALATNALLLGTNEAPRAEYLPRIAAGEITATLAHEEHARAQSARTEEMATTLRAVDGGYVLDGVKRFVVDGHTASLLLVVARVEKSADIVIVAVPGDAVGVTREALPTMDMTRKLADVTLKSVRVPSSAIVAEPGAGASVLQKTLDRARIALAAEQVGGAQRCLEMSVDYAKVRTQFGRPIGSFQAIKHKCADIYVDVESARSASYYAACIAAGTDDAELTIAASTAKAFCSEAYFRAAAETIQVHGGIGFTWEHDTHLYFKRAKASEAMLGDPESHRDVIAGKIGLQ
jgi:alkylation response protein AidB-like acyl-CoA dehydrogenase